MTAPSGRVSRYFPFSSWKQVILWLAAGVLGGGGFALFLHWRYPIPHYTLLDAAKAVGSGIVITLLSVGLVGALTWVGDAVRRR